MTTNIFLATGGTGGHIFPAVSVAERLTQQGYTPIFITDRRGRNIIKNATATTQTHIISAASPYAETLIKRAANLTRLTIGLVQTALWMTRHRPHAVIGFGGYFSVAPILFGKMLGLATMLHEQNAFFGRANRFLAGRVDAIALSWAETSNIPESAKSKTLLTGMPVRDAFSHSKPYAAPTGDEDITLLITGGSLGAQIFDEIIPQAIALLPQHLRKRVRLIHQTRPEQIKAVKKQYEATDIQAEILAFIDDMPKAMHQAHLIICRAGASSVAELATSRRPAILVPFPHAMDDHQTQNALRIAKAKGGWCLAEDEMNAEKLAEMVTMLLGSPKKLNAASKALKSLAHKDAASLISERIAKLIKTKRKNS